VGVTEQGWPIYERMFGAGFSLVVESRRGGSNAPLEMRTFVWDPGDPSVLPGVQVLASRPLGNGSTSVCDDAPPAIGGVPGLLFAGMDGSQVFADAVNDMGCRFKDGVGQRRGRDIDNACTVSPDGFFRMVNPASSVQYCGSVTTAIAFPSGDTVVAARVQDVAGNVSATSYLVVRVLE